MDANVLIEMPTGKIELVYPELSYQIVGAAFDVYNEIGNGHHEKYYQRALAESFRNRNLTFQEQVFGPLKFNRKTIGKSFFDFLVENRVIVEIKKGERFSKSNIDQVLEYLKTSKLQLALLINFANDRVKFRRIVNLS